MVTHFKQKMWLLGVGLLLAVGLIGQAAAASKPTSKTTTTDLSSGVTQSYSAASNIQIGMVVQLKDPGKSTIIPLSQAKIKNMLGVVIPTGNSTITLTPADPNQSQVLVASSGQLIVLVSNQNGNIKSGDYVSLSSVDGIAMKADDSQALTLGRAEGNFDGKSNAAGNMKLKDSLHHDVNVSIGRIPVEIGVTHNPSFHQQDNDYVPGFIGKIVFQVTSKHVSAARVYIAMVLLIGIVILTANVLFGGVRGGMIAIGRNPLSKKSIIVSLVQTVFAGAAIFVGGVALVYFLLKI